MKVLVRNNLKTEHKEEFKNNVVVISAGGTITMEEDDARQLLYTVPILNKRRVDKNLTIEEIKTIEPTFEKEPGEKLEEGTIRCPLCLRILNKGKKNLRSHLMHCTFQE